MSVEPTSHVSLPPNVLVRKLADEAVLLNLDSEQYYGLDDIGTRMLDALCAANSVEAAYDELAPEYDVDPQTLRSDLCTLVEQLVERGLLEVSG